MVEYYSFATLAKRLDVSVRVLGYWALHGRLPGAIKLGKEWRVKASIVDGWLEEKHREQQGRWQRLEKNSQKSLSGPPPSPFQTAAARALREELDRKLLKKRAKQEGK